MKKLIFILFTIFLSFGLRAQEGDYFGGAEIGVSSTKLNLDSLSPGFAFSPLIGFSFQKQLVPKLYLGLSTIFTRKGAVINSPSLKYQLSFIDWRFSLQYRIKPNLFLEGGAALSQFIGGRIKKTSGDPIDQKDNFSHQTNPYLGLRYKIKENIISAKYYLPNLLLSSGIFSSKNQFSYGEVSISIPFKKSKKERGDKEKEDLEQAKKEIKELKSGILLVALSGSSSKEVQDRELDYLLVEAFKEYSFSKYFIVDLDDLDSLRKTNRIGVFEDYPFTEKQKINLENFTWFVAKAGKTSINQNSEQNTESYNMNALIISNSEEEKLSNPFPYFVNYSEGSLPKAITSLNAQLERFYYEANFGL